MTQRTSRSTRLTGSKSELAPSSQLALLTIAALAPAVATSSMIPSFLILAAWAIRTPQAAVQALSVSWVLVAVNPSLLPNAAQSLALRWLVFSAALAPCVFAWVRLRTPRYPQVFWLLVFLGAASASAATSALPLVALGKLAAFGAGVLTLILAAYLTSHLADYWYDWFSTILFGVVVVAIPLVFLELGYTTLIVGRGFRGFLNYSQGYGSLLAVAVAFFAARLLLPQRRVLPPLVVVAIGSFLLILTRSRGAILATIAGLLAIALVGVLRRRSGSRSVSGPRTMLLLVLMLPVLLGFWASVSDDVEAFILKRGDATVLASIETRAFLIDESLEGFRSSPLVGTGFGLPSVHVLGGTSNAEPINSLYTLPVEKGFLPAAVLEWTGLVGIVLFSIFLWVLIVPILRFARIEIVAAVASAFATNVYEATMLSIGGLGLVMWLVVFWGFVDSRRAELGVPAH